MYSIYEGQSEWQKRKDDIILNRIEKNPEREKELLILSDRADKLILKCRQSNYDIENKIGRE